MDRTDRTDRTDRELAPESRSLPYTDIDLRRWREYAHVETDSLWLIPSRERGAGHQLDYHGGFVPQIATQVLLRYSRRGDVVLDLFLGSGTTAIEAVRLGRRCVGMELKPDLVAYVRGKLPAESLIADVRLLEGDSGSSDAVEKARAALATLDQDSAQVLILHPPYHDIIQFSDRPDDLSNSSTLGEFLARFEAVARNGYALLESGRFAALVVGDKYARGELVPLGFLCMARMNEVGFRTRALVVKNIEGNEKGKGRASNLWRYRALAGGFYIFKHEYVMIFQKPK